jgi:hypothetical protein
VAGSVVGCTVAFRQVRKLLKEKRGRSLQWSRVAVKCSRSSRRKESRFPWGRKRGGVNRSVAERQLARATKQHAERDATLKNFSPRNFGRSVVRPGRKLNARLNGSLRSNEEQIRRFGLPPLSSEQQQAVIEGFRQRVAVSSDEGSMRWSDVRVLQDRLRDADDALERSQAEAAWYKRSAHPNRST